MTIPPLPVFCINVLASFPDLLFHCHDRRIHASPAILDAFTDTSDPCRWAALAQLVHPLPPHLHDYDLPLSHPALPLLQKIPDSPHFSLVTLLALPNCVHLRDDDVANLRSLHRLLALDLRACSISPYALTALARGLAPSAMDDTRSGPWGLRLLSLHGCPNIDDDVLPVLHKFPLLSVIGLFLSTLLCSTRPNPVPLDLRFTRCTPAAVNAHLSSLGFHPSDNNSLFHPAPLSLSLCSLEKVARTASDPVPLYSCPPQSVFRVHVNELNHPSHAKKSVPLASSNASCPAARTISSAEETVVFIPPLAKQAKKDSFLPSESSASSTAIPEAPTSSMIDPPTDRSHVSNVLSFYANAPAHSRKNALPLFAQAVQSPEGGKLDPLAIARPPPSWTLLDTHTSVTTTRQNASDNVENSRRTQPISCWIGQALNNPLKVDRTRLHKRGSDAVADMVHQFTSKRPRVESEFALAKKRAKAFAKSRNPFARGVRSVFAESSTTTSDEPRSPAHESRKGVEPDAKLRASRSLPLEMVRQQETNVERILNNKPLKPITSIKPPILPKELLPSLPRHASKKPRSELKQTRLAFAREVE